MALDEIRDSLGDIEASKRLQLATEAAEIGIWEWDLLTNRMRYSRRARAIYGFSEREEITLEGLRAHTHPYDLPRTSEMGRRARDPALKERIPYEYRVVWPDGRIRWVVAYGHVIFEQNAGVERAVRYIGTIQDITARKEMEFALEESRERLQLAIDAGRMAVWEFDVVTEAVVSSPQLNRILGFADHASPSIQEIRAG
jgi:PAS domain S-box-containing protein